MRVIRPVTMEELDLVKAIYAYARQFMRENGNPTQWGDDRPPIASVLRDIENKDLYGVYEDGKLIGVFFFKEAHDETYDVIRDGAWLNDGSYGVIHRLAAGEGAKEVLKSALEFAEPQVQNMRVDTHENNKVMQHLMEKFGYTYCGIIVTDDGTDRLAYHKVMEE